MIMIITADDCHLQCNFGRKLDSNGSELCECFKVPDQGHFAELEHDVEQDNYVTAADNEALSCPKVPCSRMCPHGFQVDRRGCPICKCQRCKSISKCHKKCALGLVHDSRGCATCQCRSPLTASPAAKCQSNNQSYSSGERWQLDDCTSCICHHGGPTCTEMTCPLPCHNPLFIQVCCHSKEMCRYFTHSCHKKSFSLSLSLSTHISFETYFYRDKKT